MDYKKFFEKFGVMGFHDKANIFTGCSIEDLYQAFRARFVAEELKGSIRESAPLQTKSYDSFGEMSEILEQIDGASQKDV